MWPHPAFNTVLVNTSSKPKFTSTTIQDYCILGTSIVLFYGFGFLGCGFGNGNISLEAFRIASYR
jgi:hypothetical protein